MSARKVVMVVLIDLGECGIIIMTTNICVLFLNPP